MNKLEKIDIVGLLLKGKASNTQKLLSEQLSLLQHELNQLEKELNTIIQEIQHLNTKHTNLKNEFSTILEKNDQLFKGKSKPLEDKVITFETKIRQLNHLKENNKDTAKITALLQEFLSNFKSTKTSLENLKTNYQTESEKLISQQTEILSKIKEEINKKNNQVLPEVQKKVLQCKDAYNLFDKLFKLTLKNPKTLFNDNSPHDLALFAHKNTEFKGELNEFIYSILLDNNYPVIVNKVSGVIEKITNHSKGLSVNDLIEVYRKLILNVKTDGFKILDKSIISMFINAELEKALRHHRDDITILEMIQISRLNIDIYKNILDDPICLDYFISLVRAEINNAIETGVAFSVPTINWDVIKLLKKEWPLFFLKFGNSLCTFDDLTYVRLFHQTINKATPIVHDNTANQTFILIVKLRNNNPDTFGKNFTTKDFITVLYETVSISVVNELKSPYHKEVLKVCSTLDHTNKSNFLRIFDSNTVARMIAQEKNVEIEEQESIYLTIDKKYLNQKELMTVFGVNEYEQIPINVLVFLETLQTNNEDLLNNLKTIINMTIEFQKNIKKSIVSNDHILPVVNKIKEGAIKYAELISHPYLFEKLIFTKEMNAALNRRQNITKTTPSVKVIE